MELRGSRDFPARELFLRPITITHNTNRKRLGYNHCTQLEHSAVTKAIRPEEFLVTLVQHFTPTSLHFKFLGVCVQVLDGRQERSCEFNAANIVFVCLLTHSQWSQLSQLVPLIILFYSNVT